MAALTPQTILCIIARLSPAGSLVKPPPRQAASPLYDSVGKPQWVMKQKANVYKETEKIFKKMYLCKNI